MRATSLLGIFVLARILMLFDHEVEWSVWTLPAYLWQDLLCVLVFGVVDCLVQREWFGWTIYVAIVAYVAINVPITRAVSSPLTWPMLRATGGELADSIEHYLTLTNMTMLGSLVLLAIALPFATKRIDDRKLLVGSTFMAVLIGLGPTAIRHVNTRGHHRNVFAVLLTTTVPRVAAEADDANWRMSPFSDANSSSSASAQLQNEHNTAQDWGSAYKGAAKDHNVILIILESVGAGYLKPYGASRDPMPHFSKLAAESLLFENTYVVYPESIKGLVSVLSSVTPALDTEAEQYEHVGTCGLASELSRAGYHTGLFHSGRFMYLGMNSVIRGRGFDVLEDAGDISGEYNSSFGVDEPATVKQMLAWIDAVPAGEKFFATYMPIAGHHPYDTPESGPYPEDTELNRYHNALHYADQAIGQVVDGLATRGLTENTMLVIVGDHGQAFGQHEDNYGHTFFLYEENVKVPFLISIPRTKPKRVTQLVSVLDVAPTVMQLIDKQVPPSFEGKSLLDHKPANMALFFTDYSLGFLGLRDGNWKFIYELESGRTQLFDLRSDPRESENLAGAHRHRAATYRDHLLRWCAAQRAAVLAASGE